MDEKVLDEILDKLVKEAGPMTIEEMEREELQKLEEPAFEFSPEHEEKMQKLFEEVDKQYAQKDAKPSKETPEKHITRFPTGKKVLLMVAVIAVLTFGVLMTTSGAFRESFVKMFLADKEKYSDVKNGVITKEDFRVDNIYFGYMPKEYECVSKKEMKDGSRIIVFEDGFNSYIILNTHKKSSITKINTESGETTDIIINQKDMIYYEKMNEKYITWLDKGTINTLSTNESKELLVKIVKNIELLDEESQ